MVVEVVVGGQSSLFLVRDGLVGSADDGVVTLEGLEGHLLLGLEAEALHLGDLSGEDLGGGGGGVNAVGLDANHESSSLLEVVLGVDTENTGLVGLGNIHEDAVDEPGDEHAVLQGVTGILEDGDNVGATLGHLLKVATAALRELNGVDDTLGADKIGNVGDGGTAGSSEVQHGGAGLHADSLNTVVDGGGQLGAVGVPDTELAGLSLASDDTVDALLSVDGDTGHEVLGAQALADQEGSGEASVGLGDVTLGGSGTTASSSASSTASSAASSSTTAHHSTAATAEATASSATATTAITESSATGCSESTSSSASASH